MQLNVQLRSGIEEYLVIIPNTIFADRTFLLHGSTYANRKTNNKFGHGCRVNA